VTFTRRSFLKGAALAGSAAALGGVVGARAAAGGALDTLASHSGHGLNVAMGGTRIDDFDPYTFLTAFDWGNEVGDLGDGRKIREYFIEAVDKNIEVVPGVSFPAWTFNGGVPGPTLRAREGDRLRIHFTNKGAHPHTMHFHGIHAAEMDGVPGSGPGEIQPGGTFTYEFDAEPHGVHLYHCHALPLKRHIHKGLYGAYIVEPAKPEEKWEPAHEMVMVLNGFDTNLDGENEIYSVNTKAFAYVHKPIRIRRGELQRVFLVNITEFDPLNSLHLHGNFFHYTEIGHRSNPRRFTDNVSLIQGERGMLEFKYNMAGRFMFHAHQSELAELGWVGMFEVTE
jgi:FtsP/CotA-like multicopper oxidase with cupredoxin domain